MANKFVTPTSAPPPLSVGKKRRRSDIYSIAPYLQDNPDHIPPSHSIMYLAPVPPSHSPSLPHPPVSVPRGREGGRLKVPYNELKTHSGRSKRRKKFREDFEELAEFHKMDIDEATDAIAKGYVPSPSGITFPPHSLVPFIYCFRLRFSPLSYFTSFANFRALSSYQ